MSHSMTENQQMPAFSPKSCWVVSEGAAGMENQALGLAERLGLPVTIKRVRLAKRWGWMAPRLPVSPFGREARGTDRLTPPWPRIAIGCGRQSIPFMLAIKKASPQTLIVQCQHPRIDPARFDLVLPPLHDGLIGANVLPLEGSPNRITTERLEKARKPAAIRFAHLRKPILTVLVGGKSAAYRFTAAAGAELGHALASLAQTHGLIVLPSRRTGAQTHAQISNALAGSDAFIWDRSGDNPYLGALALADAFLVTSDSVNMACEAAATGKPVHIFALPGGTAKFNRFHASLEAKGITRPFTGKIEQWRYAPLDETGRATTQIRALLDLSGQPTDMNL